MQLGKLKETHPRTKRYVRISYGTLLVLFIVGVVGFYFIAQSKEVIFKRQFSYSRGQGAEEVVGTRSFPVGVDPIEKVITEHPELNSYI